MLRKSGYLWIVVSILHGIIGVVLYSQQWRSIAQAGWFNAVSPDLSTPMFDREAAFWIVFLTPFIFLIGQLCLWSDRHQIDLPISFSFTLLGTVLVGLFLMPVSGFWLALIPTLMMLYAAITSQFTNRES